MMNTQHQWDEHKHQRSFVRNLIEKINKRIVPICLVISATISLCMLVIGSLHVNKCPVNKCIPIFLIAAGAMGIISKILSFVRKKVYVNLAKITYMRWVEMVVYFAEVVVLFLGTYWVFKEFQPSFNPSDKKYCNKTAYMFAFIYLIIHYSLLILAIVGLVILTCCLAAGGSSRDSYTVESQPVTTLECTERLTIGEENQL